MWSHRNLSILALHRIAPLPDENYPFVKGVISCDVDMFDRQLAFVKKHFNVINFRDVLQIHEAENDIPPNSLILTFDDGYADNYTQMLPVLESHGLTAVVFLATHYIETGELFWVDKLAFAVNRCSPCRLSFLSDRYVFDITDGNREQVRRKIGHLCATVDFSEHMQIMQELDEQVEIKLSEEDYELARPLTWGEVAALEKAGVEIGSHTVMHGFLDRMSFPEIERELRESKEAIDKQLSEPAITVCYPAGKYTREVLDLARQCGYKYGCSYRHGTAVYSSDLQFVMPRIHVDYDIGFQLFKANLILPSIFLR